MSIFAPRITECFEDMDGGTEVFSGKLRSYRCTGYMRLVRLKRFKDEESDAVFKILDGPKYWKKSRYHWEWCTRRQAQFVTGAGIAGCCIHIARVGRIGRMTAWTPEMVASAQQSSRHREGEHFYHGDKPTADQIMAGRCWWRRLLANLFLWGKQSKV